MNRPTYTVIIHKNGKRKAYHTEKYLLIKRLKFIGALVSAAAVMLLFCGMAIRSLGKTRAEIKIQILGGKQNEN